MPVLTPTRVAIKNVLFATDFSPLSEAALPYATAVARKFDAKLHLVHILTPSEWHMPPEAMVADADRLAEEQARARMATLVKGVEEEHIPVHVVLKEGIEVWHEVAGVIRSDQIDLVVLGTHGREGLQQFLLGSVAEEVFRMAPCPVLTVGPRAGKRSPRPFRTIGFATDLTEESLKSVPYVFGFVEEHQARLLVMHVPPDKAPTHAERALTAESVRKWMRELIPPRPDVEFIVPFGEPAAAILRTAEDRECDLLMLGAHAASSISTHLPGAVAHKVVAEAPCPVLVVHSGGRG